MVKTRSLPLRLWQNNDLVSTKGQGVQEQKLELLDDAQDDGTDLERQWLDVSPYHEKEHLLDLMTLDASNRLLALALTALEPATSTYANVKYEEALNWDVVMKLLRSLISRKGYNWQRQRFYVVEFRSKLGEGIDVDRLFQLDKMSHQEATRSGGLLKYWYGVPDSERRNLATCEQITPRCDNKLTDLQVCGGVEKTL
jgi:hypothetical protein